LQKHPGMGVMQAHKKCTEKMKERRKNGWYKAVSEDSIPKPILMNAGLYILYAMKVLIL